MQSQLADECMFFRVNELKQGNIQLTDSTNAARLIKEHGNDIRYNKAWKKWVVWNGKFWETDESGCLIHEKGLEMIRNIYGEILKTDDLRERLEIEKFAKISESVRRRENLVKAAQYVSALNITSDKLDPDPRLLNVQNGTINILTGEFTEHYRENMITKITNIEYNPKADCPLWKQFVREIMNYNSELIYFIQTAAGWSMTGDISEQVMFILYGTGANGKSTFLNAIQHILGEYSTSTNTETFMKKTATSTLTIWQDCGGRGL